MLVILGVCLLFVSLEAYPDGAPELGCYTSRPLHGDNMPQWTNAPYILEFNPPLSTHTYVRGQPMKMRLRSLQADTYKLTGYLITMVSSGGFTGGSWTILSNSSKAIPDCGITQTNVGRNRTSVEFEYTPPADLTLDLETIQFRAIAVHSLSVFWDNILSPYLRPKVDRSASEIDRMLKEFQKYAQFFDLSLTGLDGTQQESTPPVPPPSPPSPPSHQPSTSSSSSSSRSGSSRRSSSNRRQ